MAQSLRRCPAKTASQSSLRREGAAEHEREGLGHLLPAQQQHQRAAAQIKQGHGGDQSLGHPGDAAQASSKDHPRRSRGAQADGQGRPAKCSVEGGGDGTRLDHPAPSQRGGETGQREPDRQQGRAHPIPQIEHRTALAAAAGSWALVAHRQQLFPAAGHHPQQGGYPHPKDCPWTAQTQGGGHPGDTARPHGGGQSGGQGLDGGQAASIFRLGGMKQTAQRGTKPQPGVEKGEKPRAKRVDQPGEQKAPQQPGAPEMLSQCVQDGHGVTSTSLVCPREEKQHRRRK